MFNIYEKYGIKHFEFEGYEVSILRYSNCLCSVNDIDVIKVNNDFMQLDENTQRFILYHELGHIHYKHNKETIEENEMSKRKRKMYRRFGLVVKQEIQADLYAVKMIGKANAIKAINETYKLLKDKELKTRKLLVKLLCK
jgi:Zn-dependent peptidase ImmA (M78 family)